MSAPSRTPLPTITMAYRGSPGRCMYLDPTKSTTSLPLVPRLKSRHIILDKGLHGQSVWVAEITDTDVDSTIRRARVVAKWIQTDPSGVAREFQVYKRLATIQGTVVPQCYGFYAGSGIACLLLEYLETVPYESLRDKTEVNRLVMVAMCKVHKAGIEHRALFTHPHILICLPPRATSGPLQRSIVPDHEYQVRIISFRNANMGHTCPLDQSYPVLHDQPAPRGQCQELLALENGFGIRSGDKVKPQAGGILAALRMGMMR